MEMLQNMTKLLESRASRRAVPDVPYLEIAGSNLVFAWGKQLQASSSRGEADVSHCTGCISSYEA